MHKTSNADRFWHLCAAVGLPLVLLSAMIISARAQSLPAGEQPASALTGDPHLTIPYTGVMNSTLYLPTISNDLNLPGLYGYVTHQGQPIQGIVMLLRYYPDDGTGWHDLQTVRTDSQGYFFFGNLPALSGYEAYSVLYQNGEDGNPYDTNKVDNWSKYVGTFDGEYQYEGTFELATPALTSPAGGVSLGMPITFHWSYNYLLSGGSVQFFMEDTTPGGPVYFSPTLTGSEYTLTTLPSYFSFNHPYRWSLYIYNGSGGVAAMVYEQERLINLLP